MQNAPNASKHFFSPQSFLLREKIGPPEARQKRPRRNEPPQATSLILCARFFLSKPQTEFAVWVLSQICDNLSVSLRLTAPPERGARGCVRIPNAFPLCEEKPLSAAAGFNPSVAFGASSLYTREPWGARKKPSLRRKAQKRPRRNALLSGPVTENSEHHTPQAAARQTARPAPGRSRRCGRP